MTGSVLGVNNPMSGKSTIENAAGVLWYVIQTKPQAEDAVEKHLHNAKFETFLPKIRAYVRGKKRSVSRIKTLFPSYIFAHIDLNNPNLYHMIKYTRGVRRILGDGMLPVPIPEDVIKILKKRMSSEGVIEQRLTMKSGDRVRLKSGAFRELVGILEKPVPASGRVRVLLEIMNRQISCVVPVADIERTDD